MQKTPSSGQSRRYQAGSGVVLAQLTTLLPAMALRFKAATCLEKFLSPKAFFVMLTPGLDEDRYLPVLDDIEIAFATISKSRQQHRGTLRQESCK